MPAYDHVFIDADESLLRVRDALVDALAGARVDELHDDHAALVMKERTVVDLHADGTFANDPELRVYRFWVEVRDHDTQ